MGPLEQNLILIAIGVVVGLVAALPVRRARAAARAQTRDLAREMATVIGVHLAAQPRPVPVRVSRAPADRARRVS